MTDITDTHTDESIETGDQRAGFGKTHREKTTIEFFREKFADADAEETVPIWIDPKGDRDELFEDRFRAGQTGAGNTTELIGLLDDGDAGSDREAES